MRKKAIAMTFNWIFAIIVGAFILFLAIYASGKFIKTSEQSINTKTAASLISIFDPLTTGLASGKGSRITFKKESRIFFNCNENSNLPFGQQTISFSEQTFGEEYGEVGGQISIKDQYIFTQNLIEGKTFYYFSKPFFLGYKVMDQFMIYSDKQQYCVYDPSEDFKDDIEGLNLNNIFFPNQTDKCEGTDICFITGSSFKNCDIKVFQDQGYIQKDGRKLYYVEDLLFGAIFSSPEIYECNIKRIKGRFNELAKIHLNKIDIIRRKNCEPTLGPKLLTLMDFPIRDSRDMVLFYQQVLDLDSVNQRAKDGCKLYYNINFKI